MRNFTHLFFDLGDTLVDLRGLFPAMVRELSNRFPELGERASTVAARWIGRTAESTPRALGTDYRPGLEITGEALLKSLSDAEVYLEPAAAIRVVRSAWDSYLQSPKFFDDVTPEFLWSLRARVKGMGLVTDSDEVMVRPLLARLELENVFDVIVVSDAVRTYKPDPKIYQVALSKAGALAPFSAFVSDSLVDLRGAADLGMGTIWVNRQPTRHSETPPRGTVVLDDLRRLEEALAKAGDEIVGRSNL